MEVLEQREWWMPRVCNTCTSKLRVERLDVLFWDNGSSGDNNMHGYHFQCPVCKTWNSVPEIDLPKAILNDAAKRWIATQNL